MNIKDPEVHRLAHALAQRRGISATRAVREALEETIRHDSQSREGLAERLLSLQHRSRAIDEPLLTDDDLYGPDGLPR